MAALLAVLLLGSGAAAAPSQPGPSKGLRLERRSDCLAPAAFERLLAAGADGWGTPESEAQRSVDLLAAAVQCRAFAAGSERECDALAGVPRFPAASLLAADCRLEHQLLTLYDALRARDAGRAEAACARWHELGRPAALKGVDAPAVCRRAVALLLDGAPAPCERLEREAGDAAKEARQRQAAAALCRAVGIPGEAACVQKGLPLGRKACETYGRLSAAMRARDPKLCPGSDRYGGLCRALASKEPASACEAVRADWQAMVCAGRFAPGQGGD